MERLPLFYKGLTPELIEKAEKELNETPRVKAEALKELRERIKGQHDIFFNVEDKYLLSFLRARKFNVEDSVKILRKYTSLHQKYSGIFTNRLPSEFKNFVDMNLISHSPYRLPDLSHIGILRLSLFDTNKGKAEDLTAYITTWSYIALEYEVTQIAGVNLILDLNDATFHQISSFLSFSMIKFAMYAMQDCFPVRIRGFHIVNAPYYSKYIYNVIKLFAKKKFIEKMHFHNDMENLHKIIPKEYLPQWYGGTMTPMDAKEQAAVFYSYEENIDGRKKYKTINTMR